VGGMNSSAERLVRQGEGFTISIVEWVNATQECIEAGSEIMNATSPELLATLRAM